MNSEITPEKQTIRKIIHYQKSLPSSSSSTSSKQQKQKDRTSLMNLMKNGSTSLRRLFQMEHTSLSTYFDSYSGSPVTKTIPLWCSDSDTDHFDPWESFNFQFNHQVTNFASDGTFRDQKSIPKPPLKRKKKSFRSLPGFKLYRFRLFRFRFFKFRPRFKFLLCNRNI